MGVSAEVREVETEIDALVRAMPLWRCAREAVIRAALEYHRKAGETLMAMMAFAAMQEPDEQAQLIESTVLVEGRVKAGLFYGAPTPFARTCR